MDNTLIILPKEHIKTVFDIRKIAIPFHKQCIDVLISVWGAESSKIDEKSLWNSCLGHKLVVYGEQAKDLTPEDFIFDLLDKYSDYGLEKVGLSRKSYNQNLTILAAEPRYAVRSSNFRVNFC